MTWFLEDKSIILLQSWLFYKTVLAIHCGSGEVEFSGLQKANSLHHHRRLVGPDVGFMVDL